jgi:hypothetical protein
MAIYLPFFWVGIFCSEVGRHVTCLAERIDGWLSNG